ncbi:MAG: nuclear transport factor 2 family protein [Pararobbsia sp.]
MTTTAEKLAIAKAFHGALITKDWAQLKDILADDAVWTLPGSNRISGEAKGADGIVERAQLIASYGLSFELKHVLISRDNMALSLHNTATRGNLRLDEYLSTVCFLREGKIASIETYLSDVDGMNAFFE